jgi:hypothetical protein
MQSARHGATPTKRDKPFALARGPHLALLVPDIAEAEARLVAHGIEYAKYDHEGKIYRVDPKFAS